MSIGERLRQLRESRGLTQRQLAGPEFTKSYISLIEHGKARPSVDTLALFAARLGTTVDGIMAQDGHAPDAAAQALLTLAWDAVARRDEPALAQLIGMVEFLVATYKVREVGAEIALLTAQRAFDRRDYDQAVADATRAQAAADADGDPWRMGRALSLIGRTQLRQREFGAAVDTLTDALDALRRSRAGRDPVRAEALIALGSAHFYLGDFERAAVAYQKAAVSFVAKGTPKLRGRALWGLGVVLRKRNRLEEAIAELQLASKAFETAEEPVDQGRVLQNLGQVYLQMSKPKLALRHLEHALRIFDRMRQPVDRASVLTEIARTHDALGDLDAARETAMAAIAAADQAGDAVEVAEANVVLCRILLKRDQLKPALAALRAATQIFTDRQMPHRVEEVGREFGLLLHHRGAHAEAAELLAAVVISDMKK